VDGADGVDGVDGADETPFGAFFPALALARLVGVDPLARGVHRRADCDQECKGGFAFRTVTPGCNAMKGRIHILTLRCWRKIFNSDM